MKKNKIVCFKVIGRDFEYIRKQAKKRKIYKVFVFFAGL